MITEDLGKCLQELRHRTDLSQETFALKTDMGRTYFASFEVSKRNIAICNLKRITDSLGLTLSGMFIGL